MQRHRFLGFGFFLLRNISAKNKGFQRRFRVILDEFGRFAKGDRVRVVGLQSAAGQKLNGAEGTLVRFDKSTEISVTTVAYKDKP